MRLLFITLVCLVVGFSEVRAGDEALAGYETCHQMETGSMECLEDLLKQHKDELDKVEAFVLDKAQAFKAEWQPHHSNDLKIVEHTEASRKAFADYLGAECNRVSDGISSHEVIKEQNMICSISLIKLRLSHLKWYHE